MDSSREYWAFISYRHLDNKEPGREWATWLAREIETFEVPPDLVGTIGSRGDEIPERIYPVFRDEDELSADADLSSPIYRALRDSKTVIVVCSPRAVSSRYVNNEISYFKSLGHGDRVLAMMIEGEPHAPDGRECFPLSLKHSVDQKGEVDRNSTVEPVAADFRLPDGNQGWHSPADYRKHLADERASDKYRDRCNLAKLKLIAGILGVPLGKLIERDKAYQLALAKRRARIFTAVAVAMTALAILAVAGSVFALIKREEAAEERDRAQRSERVAVNARGTAEDLIREMLFDLGVKLETINKLELLEDVSMAAEAYFDELPSDQVDADSERDRSAMLDSRARILEATGDLGGALEKYQKALALDEIWAEKRPEDPTRKLYLVLSMKNVADILGRQNRATDSSRIYAEAISIVREIVGEQFDGVGLETFSKAFSNTESAALAESILSRSEWNSEVVGTYSVLLERLGSREAALGLWDTAKDNFTESLHVNETLLKLGPNDDSTLENLLSGLYQLGNLEQAVGNIDEAEIRFEELIRIAREAHLADPDNANWKDLLAGGLEKLASTSLSSVPVKSLTYAQEALDLRRSLARSDPANLLRQHDLYVALRQLGFAATANDIPEMATEALFESLELIERLVSADPSNTRWRKDYGLCLQGRSKSFFNNGENDKALDMIQRAIEQFQEALEGNPDDLAIQRNIYFALSEASTISSIRGELDSAVDYARDGLVLAEAILMSSGNTVPVNLESVAYSNFQVGALLRQDGNVEEALDYLGKAVSVGRQALEVDPANPMQLRSLNTFHMEMGAAYWTMKDFELSAGAYAKAVDVAKELLEIRPTRSLPDLDSVAYSLSQLFYAWQAIGNSNEALKTASEEIEVRKQIAKLDKENINRELELQAAVINAGAASFIGKNFETALVFFHQATEMAESVVRRLNTPTKESHQKLIGAYHGLGQIYEADNQAAEAVSYYKKSILAAEVANSLGIHDPTWTEEALDQLRIKVGSLKEESDSPE